MRLVITVDDFDPDKGYLEYYLAQQLSRLGHKVYVFTFAEGGSVSRTTLKEGFDVVRIPYVLALYGDHIPTFRGARYVLKFIKLEKPDIVHCSLLSSPLSLLFVGCQRLSSYRVVGSLLTQEFSFDSMAKRILYYFLKIVTDFCLKNKSELFFAKTPGLVNMLTRLFDVQRERFCVIPLGADPELFRFDEEARRQIRELLGLRAEDVVIVYSGKINPSKDLDVLIKALAPIMTQHRKAKLLIIGKGEQPYIEYLRGLISELEISGRVIFYSWVHRTKLSAFYSASDIAVWPGISSISIVEAASTGLPIVMAESPVEAYGIENNNGFAFRRGNINDLRKHLETLISDKKLRKEMGGRSRLLVEKKLNWTTIAIQYLNAYKLAYDRRGILK